MPVIHFDKCVVWSGKNQGGISVNLPSDYTRTLLTVRLYLFIVRSDCDLKSLHELPSDSLGIVVNLLHNMRMVDVVHGSVRDEWYPSRQSFVVQAGTRLDNLCTLCRLIWERPSRFVYAPET
jgi:hypothetical protein